MEDFVTVQEAAEILNLTDGRIRQLILDGQFKGVEKIGPQSVIPVESVTALKVKRQIKKLRKTNGNGK